MALEFPKSSFRVGTIKDSFYSILSTIEYLEQNGKIEYQELGASPDGKVTNEFRIFPTNGMAPFAIYDYKFGLDPSDEDNFEKEFEFSIGGASSEAERSAKKLGFEVVSEPTKKSPSASDQFDPDEANTYAAFSRMGEGEVVAKGDGIKLTQAQMDDLHAGKTVKLPNGSTLKFIKEEEIEEQFIHQMKYRAGIIK